MRALVKYFLLVLCLFPGGLYGQTGTVTGIIKSAGEPVFYAGASLTGTSHGTFSDESGHFTLKEIPAGDHMLQVTALGYIRYSRKITVEPGKTLSLFISLMEEDQTMEEVVITGTMKEVSRLQSPIPVEVYTPKYFQKNPVPTIFEALQIVNGVQPQINCNVCNTGDIHVNGMEGPYTMVTIDGMPIVSALASVYGFSGIPNSIVDRVEVVKGPASTLYGSEAVGGLINIITKDPSNAPMFSFDVFGSSHMEWNADLSTRLKLGKASALFGLNYFNFNNRMDVNGDNFTDITLQNRISFFNKWRFERKDKRLASIAARYVYEDRWGGELQWNTGFRGGDSIYGESIYTNRLELIGNYQLPLNRERVLLQYSFNLHDQNSVYGTTWYIAQQNVGFAQLLWDKRVADRHDIMVGLPLRYTWYDDNTPATSTSNADTVQNMPSVSFLPGIFVQDEMAIRDKLTMLAGIRYDYNTDHGHILSPRLSFKVMANDRNTFRLSGGNGYRVVNIFTEDHAALTGSRKVIIRNELKPERSWNVNLNHQTFIMHKRGYIGLDASVFYTYFTNKITADFETDPQLIIYDNSYGHAITKGFAFNIDASFKSGLKMIAGATAMDVYSVEKDASDKVVKVPQLFAPAFSGIFVMSYPINRLGISIDYTGKVSGPMHLPVVPNDYRPSQSPWFSIQNVQLSKKFKGYELYGGVKNLLNYIPEEDPILRPFDPFDKNIDVNNPYGYTFDPSYNYAPVQGRRLFLGVRLTLQDIKPKSKIQ